MRKINTVVWVWIGVLFVAFAFVSVMVVLSRNREYFLKKKLAIGGMIISLTGFTITGTACRQCYDPMMEFDASDTWDDADSGDSRFNDAQDSSNQENLFALTGPMQDDRVVVDLDGDHTITGTVEDWRGFAFSYAFWVGDSNPISGDLEALDGSFNEVIEDFEIVVPETASTGAYELRFYNVAAIEQQAENHLTSFDVEIIDSAE